MMYYVYILRSLSQPDQTYVGFSEDVYARLKDHNAGRSPHTSKFLPWEIIFISAFPSKKRALDFERYLTSHSGKAFAAKHLI